MDSGGYKIILEYKDFLVDDCGDYYSVYKDYKHIASFKTKELAFEYCVDFYRDKF